MIRIVKRCMRECEITEQNWNGHFAFMHLKEFKNHKEIYLNGKPLKWWNRFKNGDIVEIITRPSGVISGFFAALYFTFQAFAIAHPIITGLLVAATIGAITSVATMAFAGARSSASSTQKKEYSSATQPELRGASNEISDGILPVLFGRMQQTPSYAQTPYRLVGDGSSTNAYRMYFIPNYNNVIYSDYKLGETLISNYSIDYLDVNTANGKEYYIGWENVKTITVDEELSYNSKESVTQSTAYYYNETVSASSVKYNYQLRFTNVDLAKWTNKTFAIHIYCLSGTTEKDLTYNQTITSSNLTADGNGYVYNGTHTFSSSITQLLYTSVVATTLTRGNSTENNKKLDVMLTTETVTAGSFSATSTVNQSVNNYNGSVSEVLATSPDNTTDIDVVISFPQGLYKINSSTGNRTSRTAHITVEYKQEGGQWQPISNADSIYIRDINGVKQDISTSTTTVSGSQVTVSSPNNLALADQLFFRPIGFTVPSGKWVVRVSSADFADKSNYDVGVPDCAEIQFRVDGNVINYNMLPKVNQIAVEATAYKGLSGTLKKFNYIAEAIIPVWNGSDWNTRSKTENPAAIIRYLLTDEKVNPRAEKLEHIDNESLVELYNWCEEQGYKASGIVSTSVKIGEVLNELLQNCQAAMIPLFNGKHHFVIDKPNKVPVGMFNQHNSWNFKWQPAINRQTEAIRCSFTDSDDWTEDELTVYWYDNAVHSEIAPNTTDDDYMLIKKDYKFVTDRASVEKVAAWELDTIQTKRNQFEFDVNLEAVNMLILDRVYVSNSANMQNEQTGLIKSVITSEGNLTGFGLYSFVDIPENAKIVIRSLDYEQQKPVINIYDVLNVGTSETIEIEPVPYDGIIKGAGDIKGIQDVWHYDGDLFTLGQDTIYDCTVIDIKYNDNGTATITARDY